MNDLRDLRDELRAPLCFDDRDDARIASAAPRVQGQISSIVDSLWNKRAKSYPVLSPERERLAREAIARLVQRWSAEAETELELSAAAELAAVPTDVLAGWLSHAMIVVVLGRLEAAHPDVDTLRSYLMRLWRERAVVAAESDGAPAVAAQPERQGAAH